MAARCSVANKDFESFANFVQSQATRARIIRRLKIFDDIHVEVKNEFVAAGVNSFQRETRRGGRTPALHLGCRETPNRGAAKHFFLGRIEAIDAEQCDIGIADKRWLAPKTHQLGSAAARQMSNDHAVDATGRRGRGNIQIGVAIEINHADVVKVAADAGHGSQSDRAIATEDDRQRARFDRGFDARTQILERFHDAGQIACAGTFRIGLRELNGIIAVIDDVESDGAKPID